jgi:hypothetical protein
MRTGANNGVFFVSPDTIVAKSPTRVMEAVNSAVRLFDTAGNVLGTRDLNSFFGAPVLGGPALDFAGRLFDPKVYYDRNARNPRVYIVALQVSGRGNNVQLDNISRMWVAVSRSPDPANLTTDWCRYNINAASRLDTIPRETILRERVEDQTGATVPASGRGRIRSR